MAPMSIEKKQTYGHCKDGGWILGNLINGCNSVAWFYTTMGRFERAQFDGFKVEAAISF
jgi:hypothetical protein